jgi:hypothetical protein
MNSIQRQYLFALIFIGVGIYYLTKTNVLEFSLYVSAGLSFIVNGLTLEPRLQAQKKQLVIISWFLIIATGILFLYMVQFRWF